MATTERPSVLLAEEFWNDQEGRYGAYVLEPDDDGKLIPVCEMACDDLGGVGRMLELMREDRMEAAQQSGEPFIVPVVAVFDRAERRWITSLWHPARP